MCNELKNCFKNPSQCKKKFCKLGNKLYKPVCLTKKCKAGESCVATQTKQQMHQACYVLRTAVTKFCYDNQTDVGHKEQTEKALERAQDCTRLIPDNCEDCP